MVLQDAIQSVKEYNSVSILLGEAAQMGRISARSKLSRLSLVKYSIMGPKLGVGSDGCLSFQYT